MSDNPLAYTLFVIGTIGGIANFSPRMWLAALALGLLALVALSAFNPPRKH